MACRGLDVMGTNQTLADYLVFPTSCVYSFWAILFFTLFILITFILYNREREDTVQADLISSAGVSATAVFVLMVVGSLVKSSTGIPMVQQDILLGGVAFWIIISAIWFFKK